MMRDFLNLRRTFSAARAAMSAVARRAGGRTSVGVKARISAGVAPEMLESRVLMSLSVASGGSGLSANLSTNLTIRRQQLLCDPAPASSTSSSSSATLNPATAPIGGALTITYDPTKVTLAAVNAAPGYTIDQCASQVQVGFGEGFPFTESLAQYFAAGGGSEGEGDGPPETGKLDVVFSSNPITGTPGIQPLSTGYTETQEAGPIGFDNILATFALLGNTPASSPQYTVSADSTALRGSPDFLQYLNHTDVAGQAPIAPATVGGGNPWSLPPQGLSIDPNTGYLVIKDSSKNNDTVEVDPLGRSKTGSTGLLVKARINGKQVNQNYNGQSFPGVAVVLGDGNDSVVFDPGLTLYAYVTAGNGNDSLAFGSGNNVAVLGHGNDHVLAAGSTSVTAGNGNDTLQLLGNGNNGAVLGNGKDSVFAAGGSNTVMAGDGTDAVVLGAGSNNSAILGNGNDTVGLGAGSNQFVRVGGGNDAVTLGKGSNNEVDAFGSTGSITFGDGDNNTVFYFGSQPPHVTFGTGNDDIVIQIF